MCTPQQCFWKPSFFWRDSSFGRRKVCLSSERDFAGPPMWGLKYLAWRDILRSSCSVISLKAHAPVEPFWSRWWVFWVFWMKILKVVYSLNTWIKKLTLCPEWYSTCPSTLQRNSVQNWHWLQLSRSVWNLAIFVLNFSGGENLLPKAHKDGWNGNSYLY